MRLLLALCAATLLASGCSCGDTSPVTSDGGVSDGGSKSDAGTSDSGTPDAGTDAGTDGGTLSDGGVAQCLPGLSAIAIAPANSTATVDGSGSPLTFTATGTFSGSSRDITSDLVWSVSRSDDTPPGTISGGVFSPAPNTGGLVTIHATDTCVSGQTDVTLDLQESFNEPDAGTTSRFGNDSNPVTAGANVPAIVYPNDQTRFPRNVYKILFQWKKNGDDYFRLTFAGPYSTTVVWTDGNDPQCAAITGAGCWEADQTTWNAIAGANAGATTTVTLDGVAPSDSNVYRAPPITLGFSRLDVRGAIFYWSTDAAGLRRATVSDLLPQPYIVKNPSPTTLEDGSTVNCVACHTVSRSGKKIVAGTQTANGRTNLSGEFVFDVTNDPPPTVVLTNQITSANKGFGAFSPDDSRLVVTNGNLIKEYDATSGAKLADIPAITAGTNPDWSPLGDRIAYSDKGGDSPGGADLMTLDYLGNDTWGPTAAKLVASGGWTNLFPSFSPDGHWIAYARGQKGGHGDATFDLWLVNADGGTPVQLFNADHQINNDATLTTGKFENSQPTWAPSGDYQWVAFNSARPYGLLTAAGKVQQIWVAAIDPAKLGTGEDPSFPAFRFAFQALSENNHRAFWAEDVRFPPDAGAYDAGIIVPPDAGSCTDEGLSCDPTASTCCAGLACDENPDGGASFCQVIIN